MNRWVYVAWMLFATFVIWVRANGEHANAAPYLFFFLVPIAAGTGVLSCARRGELDLLFGAGETRHRIWSAALIRGLAVPGVLALLLLALSGPLDLKMSLGASLARLTAVLLFTAGVSFTAGIIDPRFVLPVIWLPVRMLFLMIPEGLSVVVRLGKGVDMPSWGALALGVLAMPEILLEPNMPFTFVVVSALIGVSAVAWSKIWFERAEFGGKRS